MVRRIDVQSLLVFLQGEEDLRNFWIETIRNDCEALNLTNKIVLDQIGWKCMIHVDDPKLID